MDRARIQRLVHLLLDDEEFEIIREMLEERPEATREALARWLQALATPMTFGKYGRRGLLLGEVYLVDEPYLRWLVKEFGGKSEPPLVQAARFLLEQGRSPLRWLGARRVASRYVSGPYGHLIKH